MTDYTVKGDPYKLKNRENHEYRVKLINEQGETVDQWDSQAQTANGKQFLSKKEAENAIENIREDVENGDVEAWFNV